MERIVPLDSALGWAFRALQLEWSGRWHQSARVRGDSIKSPAEDHEGSHSRFGGRFGEDCSVGFCSWMGLSMDLSIGEVGRRNSGPWPKFGPARERGPGDREDISMQGKLRCIFCVLMV